ncbi:hypothetical protein C5167_031546 [Papaver somniferum]|uniref:Uncharacterized protein n=1 Tax=Papaver somniferum TaxID=3469 RepID=A0A4Y7K5U9_PAPSO|nr:hypothetical protein C5167_031546 [Papaver somniferum]
MKSYGCKLFRSKSLSHPHLDWESMRWTHRSHGGGFSRSQRVSGQNSSVFVFNRLTFEDRQKLLELAMSQVASGPLLPRFGDGGDGLKKDLMLLSERRLQLLKVYQKGGGRYMDWQRMSGNPSNTTRVAASKLKKSLEPPSSTGASPNGDDTIHLHSLKRRSVAICLKESLTPVLCKFIPTGGLVISKSGPFISESKHASQLHQFLWSGDTLELSLHASALKPYTRRAWPTMHDALYKVPTWNPKSGQEYAGLWGGTFCWAPGTPSEDKGKALFFLLLSYEESEGQQLLATKILEERFPLQTDGDFARLDIKHACTGEGIADGYGFRYPGYKPGSLFAIQDDLLAFVWKESRTVLTLQRINLQELLRKGKRVPALPPMETYLTRSYSNVYTSFSNSTSAL